MSSLVATPGDLRAAPADVCDIAVLSVGRATPALAAAVSKGLGLPVEAVVRSVYRAPAVLLKQVAVGMADKLCQLLNDTGLDVAAVPAGQDLGEVPLLDAAAHLREPARAGEAAAALAQFTGLGEDAALTLLLTPPGVVLGSVSAASIAALRACMPEGVVDIVEAAPQQSRYALHLLPCAEVVARGVLDDLRKQGLAPLAAEGIVAVDLDHPRAQALWQRHSRSGALRLIHTAFLRYAVSLQGKLAGPDAGFNAEQARCLVDEAGVPAEMLDAVEAAMPIVLHDDVPHIELPDLLSRYARCGLQVQADLSSFRHYRLEVVHAPDPVAAQRALVGCDVWPSGQALPAIPFTAPEVLTRPRARQAQALLQAVGAEACLVAVGMGGQHG